MLGATMYLAGRDADTGELLTDTTSCSICRRLIINAGIQAVVAGPAEGTYTVTPVQEWIDQDDSLDGLVL